jgi:putative phosphonoacetaldehyde dehydrogenase
MSCITVRSALLRSSTCPQSADQRAVAERIAALPGIETVLTRAQAAERFELPPDRIGDLVVVSRLDTVIGTSAIGMICPASTFRCARTAAPRSKRCRCSSIAHRQAAAGRRWRNFDAFDLGLNLADSSRIGVEDVRQRHRHRQRRASRFANRCASRARSARDRVIEVRHPYSGELVGTVPKATLDDVKRALQIARGYRSKLTRHDRYTILMKAGAIIASKRDELARLITLESGLCLKDSLYEVGRASDVLLFAANQALVDDNQVFSCDLTAHGKSRKVYTLREPLLGAITAITPFNHPLNQVIHKVAPVVATNNRVVLKPSEKTPLTAFALADILYEAGLPPADALGGDRRSGRNRRRTADERRRRPRDLHRRRCDRQYIAAKAVYKRQVLELGGNDPIIVLEDADIEEAATLAAERVLQEFGQRCTAVKRMLVQENVADRFVELLVEKTRAVKYGDPFDPAMDMGTVIDAAVGAAIRDVVNEAVAAAPGC